MLGVAAAVALVALMVSSPAMIGVSINSEVPLRLSPERRCFLVIMISILFIKNRIYDRTFVGDGVVVNCWPHLLNELVVRSAIKQKSRLSKPVGLVFYVSHCFKDLNYLIKWLSVRCRLYFDVWHFTQFVV